MEKEAFRLNIKRGRKRLYMGRAGRGGRRLEVVGAGHEARYATYKPRQYRVESKEWESREGVDSFELQRNGFHVHVLQLSDSDSTRV